MFFAADQHGIKRLVEYMTRCPFSLSRLVKVTATGQVVCRAEKQVCRALPNSKGNEPARGPKRDFQILSPLEFLAEFAKHIPPRGSHLIRHYGWYSNKAGGPRRKRQHAAAEAAALGDGLTTALGDALTTSPIRGPQGSSGPPARSRASHTWAMPIKRACEVDPLVCPRFWFSPTSPQRPTQVP